MKHLVGLVFLFAVGCSSGGGGGGHHNGNNNANNNNQLDMAGGGDNSIVGTWTSFNGSAQNSCVTSAIPINSGDLTITVTSKSSTTGVAEVTYLGSQCSLQVTFASNGASAKSGQSCTLADQVLTVEAASLTTSDGVTADLTFYGSGDCSVAISATLEK